MHKLRYSEVSQYLKAQFNGNDAYVASLSTDTRTLQAGDTFLALQGKNFDGHHYINKAIQLGAGGLIVSQPTTANMPVMLVKDTLKAFGQLAALHSKKYSTPTVAITGSCGKTTTTNILMHILSQS